MHSQGFTQETCSSPETISSQSHLSTYSPHKIPKMCWKKAHLSKGLVTPRYLWFTQLRPGNVVIVFCLNQIFRRLFLFVTYMKGKKTMANRWKQVAYDVEISTHSLHMCVCVCVYESCTCSILVHVLPPVSVNTSYLQNIYGMDYTVYNVPIHTFTQNEHVNVFVLIHGSLPLPLFRRQLVWLYPPTTHQSPVVSLTETIAGIDALTSVTMCICRQVT